MNIHKIIKLSLQLKAMMNEELKEFDLTLNQWLILKELNNNQNQGSTLSELVVVLKSDKATISQCIKRLEVKEYVDIVVNDKDKRKKRLFISDKARQMCQSVVCIEDKINLKIRKEISIKEEEEFTEIVDKLLNLKETNVF